MRITRKWKNILSIGLAVLVLFGAVGVVASFATNDSKPAGAVFKVGGLDPETGKYVKTDKTIYTEEAIDAYGLRIEPDFESTVTYDIYYYDNEDKLLAVVEGQTEIYDEDFEVAEKCRIVVHPEIPEDTKEKDFKVHFWDIAKYASMLKITVSKESNGINYENLLKRDDLILNAAKIIDSSEGISNVNINDYTTEDAPENSCVSPVIEIDASADGIIIFAKLGYPPESYGYFFLAGEDGYLIDYKVVWASIDNSIDGWNVIKLSETDLKDASYFRLSFDNSECLEDFYVYTYND